MEDDTVVDVVVGFVLSVSFHNAESIAESTDVMVKFTICAYRLQGNT